MLDLPTLPLLDCLVFTVTAWFTEWC